MFADSKAFSSFSTNDIRKAKEFYGQTLGLNVTEQEQGLALHLSGGGEVFIYQKQDHQAATFTVLNFETDDIKKAVDDLNGRGITFEQYGGSIATDEKGIFRGDHGPVIGWFKDPAGNIISVFEK